MNAGGYGSGGYGSAEQQQLGNYPESAWNAIQTLLDRFPSYVLPVFVRLYREALGAVKNTGSSVAFFEGDDSDRLWDPEGVVDSMGIAATAGDGALSPQAQA